MTRRHESRCYSINDQWQQDKVAKHKALFGPSHLESSYDSTTSWADPKFRRTSSIRKAISRGSGYRASMLGAFGNKKSSKEISSGATIHNLDPQAFPNKDSKQQRVNIMLKKDKKKNMW